MRMVRNFLVNGGNRGSMQVLTCVPVDITSVDRVQVGLDQRNDAFRVHV